MSHFRDKKPNSFRKIFSRFFSSSVDDDHTFQGNEQIDDDWEFIEFLDQELSGESDAESEIWDLRNDISEESLAAAMHFVSDYKIKYRILSKADVRIRLENKIEKICTVLALSRNEAEILLLHFKWDVRMAQEKWLSSEDEVREAVGLFKRTVVEIPDPMEGTCGFCYQSDLGERFLSASCGHGICAYCWGDHVAEAIEDGPACLKLRCPEPSCDCSAAVGREIIDMVCSEEEKKKYDEYLLVSFVSQSKKGKWCPASDCDYAVYRSSGSGDGSNDVTCRCLNSFCWNCMDEAHGPISCVAAGKWKSEILKQSGNWLLANARLCPSCERLFEESSCQMYSTCPVCNSDTRRNCGYYWSVSKPELTSEWEPYRSSELNDYDSDHLRELARKSLERFHQHYEGWSNCESDRKNALVDLKLLQDIQLGRLCDIWDLSKDDLEFLVEGQLQVVECWRILKWTYVYDYYLLEEPKQQFFEFLQNQATNLLRMLEKHVDNLQDVLMEDISRKQFINFRSRLLQLTRVTQNYYERMVDALKSDLSEVQVLIPSEDPRHVSSQGNCSWPGPNWSPSPKVFRYEDDDWYISSEGSDGRQTPILRSSPEVMKAEGNDNTISDVTRELGGLPLQQRSSPMPENEREQQRSKSLTVYHQSIGRLKCE